MQTAQNSAAHDLPTLPNGGQNGGQNAWHDSAPDSGWLPCVEAEESLFARLTKAYKPAGGLISLEDLTAAARRRMLVNADAVARLASSRTVFTLPAQGQVWIPAFQLDRDTFQPKEHVRRVVAALRPAFDDWGIAQWFIENNAWLRQRTPLAMVNVDLGEVLNAARADCFVASD